MESQIILSGIGTPGTPMGPMGTHKNLDFEGSEFERDIVLTLSLKVFRRKTLGISSGNHGRTLDEVAW